MTKRVVATAAGGPEVLELVEEPDREPGPGEVLIEVRAAGVNPVDYKRYAGGFGSATTFSGSRRAGWMPSRITPRFCGR